MIRAAASLSPAMLSKALNPERKIARHIRFLSNVLREEIWRGQESDDGAIIVVSMPPGHIKSDTCSVHLPLWYLRNWPDRRVALACYGHEKASEFGRMVKNAIVENPDQFDPAELDPQEPPPLRLATDSKAAYRWNTPAGGGMLCTGIGGALTGFRANLLIVDDPVKDFKEADSEVVRESTWNWFRTVAYTRCWPSAVILVVMTRWHEDDLAGRLLDQDRRAQSEGLATKRMRVVRMPCIAEEDERVESLGTTIFEREKGEPLWPDGGYGPKWAEQTKTTVGSRTWAAMYQQRPAPAGGSVFMSKNFRYFTVRDGVYTLKGAGDEPDRKVPEVRLSVIVVVDTAMTDKDVSDWTVCLTLGVTNDNRALVLDVARDRVEVPDQWDFVQQATERAMKRPGYLWTGCESKASGIGLLQLAQRRGKPMRELEADVNKIRRAVQAATWSENGMIYFPEDAPWLVDFEKELLSFPNGTFDDQVDALAYAIRSVSMSERRPIDDSDDRRHDDLRRDEPRDTSPLDSYAPAHEGGFRW